MSDEPDTPDPLLELFRTEVREQVGILRAGFQAMEKPGPLPAFEPLASAAHTIRGAARILHDTVVAELAIELEKLLSTLGSTRLAPSAENLQRFEEIVASITHQLEMATPKEPEVPALRGFSPPPPPVAPPPAAVKPIAPPQAPMATPPIPPPAPPPIPVSPPPPVSPVEVEEPHEPIVLFPVDPGLLELFREEVRSHGAALANGLLDLERDPASPQRIEPLMRAAHSLKGACRIVGLDLAVQLAHEMEDAFVNAQQGTIRIDTNAIDALLQAGDELSALAAQDLSAWANTRYSTIKKLTRYCGALARGESPPPLTNRVSATIGESVAPAASPNISVPPPPAVPRSHEPIVAIPGSEPNSPAAANAPPPADADGGVVRVTAQSLNRLMSLAGESLVQARWLQLFATALTEFKKQYDRVAGYLDQIAQGLTEGRPTEAMSTTLAHARKEAGRVRQLLIQRVGEIEDHSGQAEDLNSRLYREVIVSRMRPFADGSRGFPRLVRDTARQLGKQARLEIIGQQTEVDRDILDKLESPLTHLLRNAIDHGIELPEARLAAGKPAEGLLKIETRHRGGMLSIVVSDDGAGVDVERIRKKVIERSMAPAEMANRLTGPELLEFLFLPGFTTASKVTEISGRGVGLDVVQDTLRVIGGSVQVSTNAGRGTTFHLLMPLTLSVVRAVVVLIAGEPYAFPHTRIDRLVRVPRRDIRSVENCQFATLDGQHVGLVFASQLLDMPMESATNEDLAVVLLRDASGVYGLIVDDFRGEQDLVVRPLDPRLGKVPNVTAAAILDDGLPVLIADVEDMLRTMDPFIQSGTLKRYQPAARNSKAKRVLVVDDSITVREVQRQILRTHGYDVEVAVDGQDGWNKVRSQDFQLVVSDIDMPRMTGLEFVKKIRDDERLHDIPVIIVSYKDRETDRIRGLEAGANYYLTKGSFHDTTYLDAVAALIGPA